MKPQQQRQKVWKNLITSGLRIAESILSERKSYVLIKNNSPIHALKIKLQYAKFFAGNIKPESFI